MGYGGHFPYPRRFGGGRPRLKIIHDALNAARGTALDASDSTSVAWVENMAHARAVCFDGYGTNDRLALQWDPDRMTDMLSRWEQILKILPAPNASVPERREAVRARLRRFLDATALHSRILGILTRELGEYFVAVEYISAANAVIHVPDASYPWGSVVSGAPWTSTVAHILVLLTQPGNASESAFYDAAAKVGPALDSILPAWVTFNWYRAPTYGAPVNVSGGPSMGGVYLDNPANLDNNVFSQ